MGLFGRLFLRSEVNAWLAEENLIAARTLNHLTADVMREADNLISATSISDAMIWPTHFITEKINPLITDTANPVAEQIVASAVEGLRHIAVMRSVWTRSPGPNVEDAEQWGTMGDVAMGVGPMAAGMAAAVAAKGAAAGTTTAMLGLVTIPTFSWPIMAAGFAVGMVGAATGVVNLSRLPDKARLRLRKQVFAHITNCILTGTPDRPSVRMLVSTELDRLAKEALSL